MCSEAEVRSLAFGLSGEIALKFFTSKQYFGDPS